MVKVEDRIENLLKKIDDAEKRLNVAEKASEAKKIVSEIAGEITNMKAIAKELLSKKGEIVSTVLSGMKECKPQLSNLVKALEDRETTLKVKFNKLTITIDGEKSVSLSLLKKT
ncbi:MAG: hypothetical protein KKE04_04235 [Candidatus Thermoplasmatota archaeon]|nr:hypothetical protein [archaeon]MBU2565341.1 hypothetical protein [Candidatus Thermoplasmatota archaeon]MBU3902558.1 hypothetical protein [Candidatus Thermoplasmatota archaeon]